VAEDTAGTPSSWAQCMATKGRESPPVPPGHGDHLRASTPKALF